MRHHLSSIVSTQVEPVMNDFGVQCIIEQSDYVYKMKHLNQIMRGPKVNIIKVRANMMMEVFQRVVLIVPLVHPQKLFLKYIGPSW